MCICVIKDYLTAMKLFPLRMARMKLQGLKRNNGIRITEILFLEERNNVCFFGRNNGIMKIFEQEYGITKIFEQE